MVLIIILLSCLILILSFICYNLLKKVEFLEDLTIKSISYINKLSEIIDQSNNELKKIDEKGTFKSDDEVGFFFNSLKEIQNLLNEFKTK